jgi:hypothetical protein
MELKSEKTDFSSGEKVFLTSQWIRLNGLKNRLRTDIKNK